MWIEQNNCYSLPQMDEMCYSVRPKVPGSLMKSIMIETKGLATACIDNLNNHCNVLGAFTIGQFVHCISDS